MIRDRLDNSRAGAALYEMGEAGEFSGNVVQGVFSRRVIPYMGRRSARRACSSPARC